MLKLRHCGHKTNLIYLTIDDTLNYTGSFKERSIYINE